MVVRVAHFEDTWLSSVGTDVVDTDTIQLVEAVLGVVGIFGVTCLEARLVGSNEAILSISKSSTPMKVAINVLVPFNNLSEAVVVTSSAHRESVGVEKGTHRVTTL